MANLPTARVTPERPFYTSGVDYAGPFYLVEKSRSRSQTKAYICIFVCFVTKAVHIELAQNLSTDAFFNCLRRFVSRRGLCKYLYSDNGTNFVGAKNELKELKSLLSNSKFQENVLSFLSTQQIDWKMIPPATPHFGGLWESAVKSAKYHLHRVVGETRLTYEELYTVLTQVEACLNSRPLSPLSPDLQNIQQNRLNRYQHMQYMTQHFWQRWQKEYLSQLQQRYKLSQHKENLIAPGTLVILKEDNLPPTRWRLGRITELHPGSDNVTRVVSIRLANTIVKRPVSKVCILPIEEYTDNNKQTQ
ncbi:uncharacterized protein LOC127282105 [Leptopilina boulardi]|uniref:uncharacterized protein LOC127282105 n=1 Tax=Leptopilina boulardi TaxID=63433 RepID=UPI0021F62970|nr:uncharacterized protein LOC127282105 [Leptopilina boulardi]